MALLGQLHDFDGDAFVAGVQLGDARGEEFGVDSAAQALHFDGLFPEVEDADGVAEHVNDAGHEVLQSLAMFGGNAFAVESKLLYMIVERGGLFCQPFNSLSTPSLHFAPEQFVFFGENGPVLAVGLNDLFKLVAQAAVEGGVFLEMGSAVLADGVFHLAGFCFGVVVPVAADVGEEVGREEFGGGNAWVDAEIDQVPVDEGPDLCASVGEVEGIVFVTLLCHAEEIAEAAGGAAIGVAGFVGQDPIEAL